MSQRKHRRNLRKLALLRLERNEFISQAHAGIAFGDEHRIERAFRHLRLRLRLWWKREVQRQLTSALRHKLMAEIEEANRPQVRAGKHGYTPSIFLRNSDEQLDTVLVDRNERTSGLDVDEDPDLAVSGVGLVGSEGYMRSLGRTAGTTMARSEAQELS